MPIDKEKFATHLRAHAQKSSKRKCAKYVREALNAGGAATKDHPYDAKNYAALLLRNGYHELAPDSADTPYVPIKGDIAVIQPTSKGNTSGHIEGYDGDDWISDFLQRGFWPGPVYRKERPSYVIYRF